MYEYMTSNQKHTDLGREFIKLNANDWYKSLSEYFLM